MKVPYVNLGAQHSPLKADLLAAVERVLDHGMFINGPEVRAFEARLAAMLGVHAVLGCNSGTDALQLALRLVGVGPGDEVVTVSYSFVATASAIRMVGAEPVFVDVDPHTMLMDPERLDAAFTPRTRAVMPVHMNGYACDLERISAICEARGVPLIEDTAQALGTRFAGRAAGSFGIGCFSLHPLKVLAACGDAGAVAVQTEEQAVRLGKLRNIGLRDRDHVELVSGNSRLDTIQAAMLLVKLDHLEGWIEARRAHAAAYNAAFRGKLILPHDEGEGDRAVFSSYVARHARRDALVERLRARGVDVKINYPYAIHQMEAYAGVDWGPLPVTEALHGEIFSLPVSPECSVAEREHVIASVLGAVEEL